MNANTDNPAHCNAEQTGAGLDCRSPLCTPITMRHKGPLTDPLGSAPNTEHPRELDLFDSHDA